MTKDEALRLALDALENYDAQTWEQTKQAITAIKAALEAPQRTWVGLTDEEIGAIMEDLNAYGTRLYTFARAIEAAHGIKGEV